MAPLDWPGEKLLVRLWETAEKAGIGFARPWLIRREGKARASVEYQSRLAVGQAEFDLSEVRAGRMRYDQDAGRLIAATKSLTTTPAGSAPPSLGDLASVDLSRIDNDPYVTISIRRNIEVRELQRAINLEHILQQAETATEDIKDDAVSSEVVDGDWIARWRGNAQDVSNEEVQRLWARILTGELEKPGSFSFRTLDFLRSVSRSEAEMLEKVGPFIFMGRIIPRSDVLSKNGITYGFMNDLEALGLLYGASERTNAIRISETITKTDYPIQSHDFMLFLTKRTDREVKLGCYTLTSLGAEVLSLGKFKANEEHVRSIAVWLATQDIDSKLFRLEDQPNGQVKLVELLEEFSASRM